MQPDALLPPLALVAGARGKTAVVQALARIADAAGLLAGVITRTGAEVLDVPAVHALLEDPRIRIAFVECPNALLIGHGAPVAQANVAVVTNLMGGAEADAVFAITRTIATGGRVVLNADDPQVAARGRELPKPLVWFATSGQHPTVARHVEAGGDACFVHEGQLVLVRQRRGVALRPAAGLHAHDLANALAAAAAALALGIHPRAIARGLT